MRDQQIAHLAQGMRDERLRQRVVRADADRQIDALRIQVDHRIAHADLHMHVGPLAAETRQQRRKPQIAEHHRRADAQHALRLPAVRGGKRHGFFGALQHVLAGLMHFRAHFGQRQRAGRAMQQLHAQPQLQPTHAAAHGGGRQAQFARGGGKATALDDMRKHLQIGQRQGVVVHGHAVPVKLRMKRLSLLKWNQQIFVCGGHC